MKTKTLILISMVLMTLVLGCSTQQDIASKKTTVRDDPTEDPETVLAREVADGKLVEVYDEYVRVSPGERVRNWMIINNVKDSDEEFKIYPCGGCEFDEKVVTVPAGEYKIVKFKVFAMEGQKEIRVKDGHHNAYGYAQISVIVE